MAAAAAAAEGGGGKAEGPDAVSAAESMAEGARGQADDAGESTSAGSPAEADGKPSDCTALADEAMAVTAYRLSERGVFQEKHGEFLVSWDPAELAVTEDSCEGRVLTRLSWNHVTGIWVFLRNRGPAGFKLDVTLETSHKACALNYLFFSAVLDAQGGRFLGFLQESMAHRLKEGRAPSFATGRWAPVLYRRGWTVRCTRLWLGRVTMAVEMLFSLCFLAQLEKLFVSRETQLMSALWQMWGDLDTVRVDAWMNLQAMWEDPQAFDLGVVVFSWPALLFQGLWQGVSRASSWLMLLMLLQHVFTVLFMVDSLVKTLRGTGRSVMTFHKAAKMARKRVARIHSKETTDMYG